MRERLVRTAPSVGANDCNAPAFDKRFCNTQRTPRTAYLGIRAAFDYRCGNRSQCRRCMAGEVTTSPMLQSGTALISWASAQITALAIVGGNIIRLYKPAFIKRNGYIPIWRNSVKSRRKYVHTIDNAIFIGLFCMYQVNYR